MIREVSSSAKWEARQSRVTSYDLPRSLQRRVRKPKKTNTLTVPQLGLHRRLVCIADQISTTRKPNSQRHGSRGTILENANG
jgi:hypothetical protein